MNNLIYSPQNSLLKLQLLQLVGCGESYLITQYNFEKLEKLYDIKIFKKSFIMITR